MLYGISGSHRSGKTTLARAVADELGIEYINGSTTEAARQFGVDPVAPMSLQTRVDLQAFLLEKHVELIDASPRPCIIDRTPLDQVAYLLCEFGMQSHKDLTPEIENKTLKIFADSIDIMVQKYDAFFMTGLLDTPYVVDDTKATPAPNLVYQTHFNTMISGLTSLLYGRVSYRTLPFTDHDKRVAAVSETIIDRMNIIGEQKKSASFH